MEPVFPVFDTLPWACSLKDIDWFGVHKQPHADIDHLLFLYGGRRSSSYDPGFFGDALEFILKNLLPDSPHTGFAELIKAAQQVTVICEVSGDISEVAKARKRPANPP